ncbi:MAG: cellulase family glycosylhydrolase [Candidatus Njordarchaeum guaymaensis]
MRRKKAIIFGFVLIGILSLLLTGCFNNTPATPDINDIHTSMTFGVIIDYASYRFPGFWRGLILVNESKKQIDLAKELGVDFVRFDIRNEAINYPEEMEKLDTIIAYARSKNLRIYIGVYGMESWYNWKDMWNYPYGGSGKASWEEFKEMYTNEVRYLAERYKPDYMMIVPECPFNIGNQVNSVRTIGEWAEYTKEVADTVKNVSLDTKIILDQIVRKDGGPHGSSEYEFTEAIIKDNSKLIDIIGCDPYNYEDLKSDVQNLVKLKNKYNWHGDIWIGETNLLDNWDKLSRPSTPEEDEDQRNYFIYAIDLADRNGFDGFCIFYFTDDSNDENSGIGITYKDFTLKPAYDAIKQIISQRYDKMLLYSDFEDYDSFDSPPDLDSIEPLRWYLESFNANAVIDTTISRSGNKSVKLIGSAEEGSAIACGIPDNPSYLLKRNRLDAYFMFPEELTEFTVATIGIENFEEVNNVSAYIYITASGILSYATGNEQNSFDLVVFDVITLLPNKWYYVSLEADFIERKYILFDIQGENINKHYDLSGKKLHYDLSEITPHRGIYYYICYWCPDTPPTGHCWFDDASLFIKQ